MQPIRSTEILTPTAVYKEAEQICVLNICDKYRIVKKGEQVAGNVPCEVGRAEEVQQRSISLGDPVRGPQVKRTTIPKRHKFNAILKQDFKDVDQQEKSRNNSQSKRGQGQAMRDPKE